MSYVKSFHFQVSTVRSRKVLGLISCYMSQDPEVNQEEHKGCEGRRVEPNTRTFCAVKCLIKSHALHHWEYSRRRGTSLMEYLPGSKHIIKINHHSPVR